MPQELAMPPSGTCCSNRRLSAIASALGPTCALATDRAGVDRPRKLRHHPATAARQRRTGAWCLTFWTVTGGMSCTTVDSTSSVASVAPPHSQIPGGRMHLRPVDSFGNRAARRPRARPYAPASCRSDGACVPPSSIVACRAPGSPASTPRSPCGASQALAATPRTFASRQVVFEGHRRSRFRSPSKSFSQPALSGRGAFLGAGF